jgi:hypothetical protein
MLVYPFIPCIKFLHPLKISHGIEMFSILIDSPSNVPPMFKIKFTFESLYVNIPVATSYVFFIMKMYGEKFEV